jgi:hypothetical protein
VISSTGIGVVRENLMELGGDERQVIDVTIATPMSFGQAPG